MRFRHIAATCLALGFMGVARAQTPTVPQAKPDLALLNKALLGLEASKTLDTVSQFTVTFTFSGGGGCYPREFRYPRAHPFCLAEAEQVSLRCHHV